MKYLSPFFVIFLIFVSQCVAYPHFLDFNHISDRDVHRLTGQAKGAAFVLFDRPEEADAATSPVKALLPV